MVTRNARDHIPVYKNDADTVVFTGLVENRGSSSVPIVLTAGTPGFAMYTTNAGSSGSVSVEPFYVKSVLTVAGQVGGRSRFHCTSNVASGGWINALKGHMEFGASGSASGLGSAVLGELLLSAGTTTGTYAPIESELVADSAVSTGTSTSFFYANIGGSNGTGKTTINTNGYFFELGAGVVNTSDGMFEEISVTAAQVFDACLKVKIGGVNYFIGLADDKTFA